MKILSTLLITAIAFGAITMPISARTEIFQADEEDLGRFGIIFSVFVPGGTLIPIPILLILELIIDEEAVVDLL